MFFDDPVTAFVNLRRALLAGGRAGFVCWQGLEAVSGSLLVGRAVARHVVLPHFGGQARGPGMFSLCDPAEVTTLLHSAGLDQTDCDPFAPTVPVGGGETL